MCDVCILPCEPRMCDVCMLPCEPRMCNVCMAYRTCRVRAMNFEVHTQIKRSTSAYEEYDRATHRGV